MSNPLDQAEGSTLEFAAMSTSMTLRGEISPWPGRAELVQALRGGGLPVRGGRCCVVVENCEHFVFERYSPACGPHVHAEAADAELLVDDATRVSAALALHGLKHRFIILGRDGALLHYLHHDWPTRPDARPASAL